MFHILKIRLSFSKKYEGPLEEILVDDNRSYSRSQLQVLLSTVHEGNKAFDSRVGVRSRTGGLVRMMSAKAILGFVRFTSFYYMIIATELKPEGILLGHVIYSIAVALLLSFDVRATILFHWWPRKETASPFRRFSLPSRIVLSGCILRLIRRNRRRSTWVCSTWWTSPRDST